jgi:hypothetical protein
VGVVGLAVGVLTLVGQGVVPGDWNHLVNSGAVWLLFAFFAGSLVRSPGWAACAGLETLAGTLVGYYLARFVAYDMSPARGTLLFWVVLALVGGPIFGLAGSWWCDRHRLKQAAGAALLGGVFLAEGADILINMQRMRVSPCTNWPAGSTCGSESILSDARRWGKRLYTARVNSALTVR